MAEVGISIASTIASTITELLVKQTISQFRYLFCFKSIDDELKAEEKDLSLAMSRVENQVTMATNNAEEIEKDVEKWIADTATAMEELQRLNDEIQQHKNSFNMCCPNWLWRYGLSKKAAKKTMVLKELVQNGRFTTVSHPAPYPNIEFFPSKDFTPSESSKEALNQIIKALRDDNVSMIGLYGMGGVGKTTLAKEVANNAKELFDEVVFAVVSRNSLSYIQGEIADALGVKFHENSEWGRANHLAQRLQDKRKKLVILDDVWKYLDLKDIGIVDDQKNCKILLTTRLRRVCTSMNCQREIPLDVLNETEACSLLKKKSELPDNRFDLQEVAMEAAKECKGLPIAIVTVGGALKSKKTLREWTVALGKLKESRLPEIRDIDEYNAFASLKFSFDELRREENRSCLLLCSLYPEDSEIFVDDLVGYALGLGLYERAQAMESTRNEVLDAIADLKNSCMLLETGKEGYVKMHDVVRHFTLWIGSRVEQVFPVKTHAKFLEWKSDVKPKDEESKDYKAVSIIDDDKEDFSNVLVCPKLELLLVPEGERNRKFKVESNFFQEMKQLKIISLVNASLSTQSFEFLNNLQVLELMDCEINGNFGQTLKMLTGLQILRCRGSDIKELPNEIEELKNLRVLDLQDCELTISSGIIQKLCMLEELYLGDSFWSWEEATNASLSELNSLPELKILWLRVSSRKIPRDFTFPKLSGYSIHMDCSCYKDRNPRVSTRGMGHPKPNHLCVSFGSFNVCKNLFENIQELDLQGSTVNYLIGLDVSNSETKCLVDAKLWEQQPMIRFSNLKKLHLFSTSIKEICNEQPPQGFLQGLEDFGIFYCCEIITAIPENKLRQALQSVQVIEIGGCYSLQEVFQLQAANNDDNGERRPVGVKEKTKKEDDYLLSCLTRMELRELPDLRYIWKGATNHVSLKSLTSLKLRGCSNLKSIFSPSLAQSLLHLKKFYIAECRQLKHIISVTEMGEETSFSKGKAVVGSDLKLPNLTSIHIRWCPSLEYVFPISVAPQGLPRLKDISLWNNDELKSVFENETNNNTSTTTVVNLWYYLGPLGAISLPTLNSLRVFMCPKLVMHSVAKILIRQEPLTCSKQLTDSSPPYVIQLKDLMLQDCSELEHVIVVDENDHPSFKTHFQVQSQLLPCFSNLVRIKICDCSRLKSLFPITLIISSLPALYELEIKKCSKLVEVFDGVEDEADKDIIQQQEVFFQKLKFLLLDNLPSLVNFCPSSYHFIFPSLKRLMVKECPKITTIFTITSNKVHSKTKAPQDTSSSTSVDIDWPENSELPSYVEDEAKEIQPIFS